MFGQFFNIDESAFSIAPNPKYLYLSKQHEEALAHLVYGITRKGGFVLLTGDIGTGKTTICRCMFEQLPENTDIAFVINPKYSPLELLASICDELHVGYSTFQPNVKNYVKKLSDYLINAHAQGRNTVLVIDEAQNLSIDALEHIRALTNIETNDLKLLQIILIGQPELRDMLARPEFEQVNQRITARFHIGPLNLRETSQYVNYRLSVAGSKQAIFSSSNIKHIYRLTQGVPRLINILCDRILLGAFTLCKRKISTSIIKQSAAEVFDNFATGSSLLPKAIAASMVALLFSGAVVFAYQNTKFESLNNFRQHKQLSFTESVENDNDRSLEKENNIDVLPEILTSSLQGDNEGIINAVAEEPVNAATTIIESDAVRTMVQDEHINSEISSEISRIKDKGSVQLTGHKQAFRDLFSLWAVDYSNANQNPCEKALEHQLHCYQGRGNISDLAKLNRPAILKSHSDYFEPSYIVMIYVEGKQAVVSENNEFRLVSIAEVESNWSGEFEMLWRPLHSGVTHIVPGQKGEAIAALAKQLANIEGRQAITPNPFFYSSDLIEQVKTFQLTQNITADGVVGPVTQIHINNAQHANVPYLIK